MLAEKYILLLETLRSMAERSPAYADGAPKVVKDNLSKEDAEKIKKELEEQGATVELK